ncbi:MAG: cupredoxin domain-containing protein [Candidatus Binataceae bacterium]
MRGIVGKVLRLLLMSLLAGAIFVLANGLSGTAHAAGKTVVVTMTDKPPTYVPEKLTIKVGTTVEWKNNAKTLHDVTTDVTAVQNKSDVSLPPGAKSFDSGFMTPGVSWSHTFTVPGHYKYACIPHEKDHMVGEVTVTK